MEPYLNLGRDSSVTGYEIGDDFIKVEFRYVDVYVYTYESAGKEAIEEMKQLAIDGQGLGGYIRRYVRDDYARKE